MYFSHIHPPTSLSPSFPLTILSDPYNLTSIMFYTQMRFYVSTYSLNPQMRENTEHMPFWVS